nr:phenylacetaldehyde oxime monooxygenase CYP71AN24-like [Ziziphus jujuba var. spinosa]
MVRASLESLQKGYDSVYNFQFGDFFPCLSWMDYLTGLISSLKATFRELDPFLEEVIEDHKTGENNHSDKKDFMDFLFQLQKDGMLQMELTLNNLKAILLVYIFLYMHSNKMQGTVIRHIWWTSTAGYVCGGERQHHHSGMGMAELLRNENYDEESTRRETLRLHPPAALIYRETSEIVKLRGYDIPPKVMVLTIHGQLQGSQFVGQTRRVCPREIRGKTQLILKA